MSIRIENQDFSWKREPSAANEPSFKLEHITLQIKSGDCVAVVGDLGSGKSSLLYAILGEMPLSSGCSSEPAKI